MQAIRRGVRWSSTTLALVKEALATFQRDATVEQRNRVLKAFEAHGDGYGMLKWIETLPAELANYDQAAFVSILGALDAVDERSVNSWFLRMEKNSVAPTREIFEKVFRNMHDSQQPQLLLAKYKDCGFPDDVGIRTAAMTPFARYGGPVAVENMFRAMAQDNMVPSVASYNQVIFVHAKRGSLDTAQMWFDRIVAAGLTPDLTSYSHLVYGAAKAKNPREAESRFKAIAAAGFTPDSTAYNRLMHVYQKLADEKSAIDVYNRMVAAGVKPDMMTFNMLVGTSTMSPEDGMAKAERWMAMTQTDEYVATTATYHSILDGYSRLGMKDKFIEWWDKMEENVGKTPASYTLAMTCCAKSGDIVSAKEYFAEMERIFPEDCDVRSYTCVLESIARSPQGTREQVNEWWAKMEEAKQCTTNIAYNVIINYFVHQGDVAEAERYFAKMYESKLTPDIANYNTILQMYARNGETEKCKRIWDVISADDTLTPTHHTYLQMIRMCTTVGQTDEARDWLLQCLEKRLVRADKRLFNAVIKGYTDRGEVPKAEEVLTLMMKSKVKPDNYTLNNMLHGPGVTWDAADRVMSKISDVATERSYSALIQLCAAADKWERAQFWLDEARTKGHERLCLPRRRDNSVVWHEITGASPKVFRHVVTKVETENPATGWAEVKDDEGNSFYWNTDSGETQWEYPAA